MFWALTTRNNNQKFKDISQSVQKKILCINDATRYAQLLQERRETAMTHTQSFVGEGFGEKYSEW